MAGIALTALQLPGMEDTSYLGRGCFSVSMIISLLATFFACLQQRTYGFIEEPGAIRAWLSNGVRYQNSEGREALQASIVSHNLLQAPFELLCISITTFVLGFATHLGSAMVEKVPLGVEESIGNRGVLIAFCIGTAFALGLLGQVLGGKDVERNRFLKKLAKDGSEIAEPLPLQIPSYTPMSAGVSPGGITWEGPAPAIKIAVPLPKRPEHTTLEVPRLQNHASANLVEALQQAAAAHRACAAAEAEVARWYQELSNSQ